MNKKKLRDALKIVLSLSVGVFLVVYIYLGLTEADKTAIRAHFVQADYSWIFLSALFGLLSHMSRGWRWKYTLAPLGLRPKFTNSFFAVMIGYLANLAVPRLGEASRCAVMSRYEKLSFEKLLGTVIAERVADVIVLLGLIVSVFFLQFTKLNELMGQDMSIFNGSETPTGITMREAFMEKLPLLYTLAGVGIVGLIGAIFLWNFLKRKRHPIILKVMGFAQGLLDGVKAILKMEQKWAFIGHTLFIWAMYVLMIYIAVFSLPGVSDVPFQGVLAAFVMGGIAMIVVQGGLGAYPLVIMLTLGLYGVNSNEGLAFGWIIWTTQTLVVIVFGFLSLILMPVLNGKKEEVEKPIMDKAFSQQDPV